MLFGGYGGRGGLGDTWTWNGTDWTQRAPAQSPPPRYDHAMAYDSARQRLVLFGGITPDFLADTWTWDGSTWSIHLAGSISLHHRSGPPGATVQVQGWGFMPGEKVRIFFADSSVGRVRLGTVTADASGGFATSVTIPGNATPGRQHVKARGLTSGQTAKAGFTVR